METQNINVNIVSDVEKPNRINTLDLSAHQIWEDCLTILRNKVSNLNYKTWIEPIIPLKVEQNGFLLQVPSPFFFEWIEEHFYKTINEALVQAAGIEIATQYIISQEDESASEEPIRATTTLSVTPRSDDLSPVRPPVNQIYITPKPPVDSGLNPRYKFDHYVKGESNQFALAAALAVANNPGGTSFNPLVVYGGVGLGKTHLVQSIGNLVVRSGKPTRVLYISSEKFTVDFVDAIQKNSIADFSNFYGNIELLIVDDIQFFAGKEKTQDYFFHIFNALHQQGKQIVLSSDRSPKELKGLNDRLISRFQWGLTTDIQPPDLETRIAILKTKSSNEHIDLPHEVIEFIATNVTTNIRELEGCLIGVIARASLEQRTIDIELAKDVIRSVIGEFRSHITIEDIQRLVSQHFGVPEDLLRGKTRKQEVVSPRQIAMYLAKELTNSSLKTIGLQFGGRDHSTVIHAYQTVEDNMKNDSKHRQSVLSLKSKLESRL
ncbi:MAG: chromosomal replication initiator protein DnaA [Ignavibacteriales bacterium]|nr:chromosomal replication initiator protein DnaA [Ignavibacteriales bacterium]